MCVCVCVVACVYARMNVCMYIHYIFVCIWVYIHMYKAAVFHVFIMFIIQITCIKMAELTTINVYEKQIF